MDVILRDISEGDSDWLHGLNEACLPAVNQLSQKDLWALVRKTAVTRVAELDGQPVGVAMTLAPKVGHTSMNYLWFDQRFDDFLYLDRIMVDDRAGRDWQGLVSGCLSICCDPAWHSRCDL